MSQSIEQIHSVIQTRKDQYNSLLVVLNFVALHHSFWQSKILQRIAQILYWSGLSEVPQILMCAFPLVLFYYQSSRLKSHSPLLHAWEFIWTRLLCIASDQEIFKVSILQLVLMACFWTLVAILSKFLSTFFYFSLFLLWFQEDH